MQIHAASRVRAGEELTRNYVGLATCAPAPQRQAALQEAGWGFKCTCPRCRLEAEEGGRVSEATRDALQVRRPLLDATTTGAREHRGGRVQSFEPLAWVAC